MPRGRGMGSQRVKVPKVAKIPRPMTKDLRIIYKGLLTISVGNRIATLQYILHWYDQALPYMLQKKLLPPDAKKKLETEVKCRKQAQGTTNVQEKETALMTAIRLYEGVFAAMKPARLDDAYNQYKAMKDVLELRQKKMEEKYGQILGLLQKAVGNRFKFEVADAVKPIQWNPALTTLTYNREAAKNLAQQFRDQGFLPVFVEQLDYLVRHAVLEPDGKGGWNYDAAKHVETVNELLQEFIKFAKTTDAPRKLVRDLVPLTPILPGSRPTSAARAVGPRIKGPKVAGIYTPGSAAAIVYERLADGKVWPLPDLLDGVRFSHPIWLVRRMFRLGAKTGIWQVILTKTTAQLILPQQQAAVQP